MEKSGSRHIISKDLSKRSNWVRWRISFAFLLEVLIRSHAYSKNNENVTFITIFFVKIVAYENLRKLTKNLRKFKLK
jgi:hypothetical protein